MRSESFIAPGIFVVVWVIAMALTFSSTRDVSSRGIAVVDANTVRYNTHRIRLVGFDAPEVHGLCEEEVLLARWARHRLEELVSSPVVRIDLVACGAALRDPSGRCCGILYADGRDVAPTMIREGLAHPYLCEDGRCPQRQPLCTQ